MKKLIVAIFCCMMMFSAAYAQTVKEVSSGVKERAAGAAKEKAAAVVDDASITAEVKLKLADAPSLKDAKIDVTTINGVVTLTGNVKTKQAKGAATKMVKAVKGVKSVDNKLAIDQPAKPVKKSAVKK